MFQEQKLIRLLSIDPISESCSDKLLLTCRALDFVRRLRTTVTLLRETGRLTLRLPYHGTMRFSFAGPQQSAVGSVYAEVPDRLLPDLLDLSRSHGAESLHSER